MIADYRLNWIYAPARAGALMLPSDMSFLVVGDRERALIEQASPQLRRAMRYQRAGARGYALLLEGQPVCVVHFADGKTYDHWTTWPLIDGEAALVDVVTMQCFHGRVFAPLLISLATADMLKSASGAFAHIWWSHARSRRAFAKAGWRPIGFSAEIDLRPGRTIPIRLRFPRPRR